MELLIRLVSWSGAATGLPTVFGRWAERLGETRRKTALALLAQAIISGTNFLTAVMIGRCCGLDELGLYSLVFAVMLMLAVIQESLIWSPYAIFSTRLQAEDRAEYAGSALVLQGLSTALEAVVLLLAAALAWAARLEGLAPLLWILLGTAPCFLLRQFIRRLLLAQLDLTAVIVQDVLATVLQFGGFLALIWAGRFSAATACVMVGAAAALPCLVWFMRTDMRFQFRRAAVQRELRRHWSFGRWICASQLVDVAQKYALHWLLAVMAGTAATGLFAACTSVVTVFNPVLLGIGSILVPLAAQAHHYHGNERVRNVIGKTTLFLTCSMFLCCVVLIGGGDALVRLLYRGDASQGQQTLMTLLALAFLINAASFASDIGLSVVERPDINLKAGIGGLAVTLIVAAVLIGMWGVVGAALGGLLGSILVAAVKPLAFVRVTRQPSRGEVEP